MSSYPVIEYSKGCDSKEETLDMLVREGYSDQTAEQLWDAWIEYYGEHYPPRDWREIADVVYGWYESKEDFAMEYAEGACFHMDETLKDYIDWERFANDLLGQHYYMSSKGWVLML